jgi:hypothetical protein
MPSEEEAVGKGVSGHHNRAGSIHGASLSFLWVGIRPPISLCGRMSHGTSVRRSASNCTGGALSNAQACCHGSVIITELESSYNSFQQTITSLNSHKIGLAAWMLKCLQDKVVILQMGNLRLIEGRDLY